MSLGLTTALMLMAHMEEREMSDEKLGAFGEKPGTSVIISNDGVRFNPKLSAEDSDKLDRLTHSLKTLIVEFVSESGLPIRPSEAYSLIADRLAVDAVYLNRMVREAKE